MRGSIRKMLGPIGAALMLCAGCGNDDLPEFFLLDRLRVIAANTNTAAAEFAAGSAGVVINFHVSDPLGAGRTLTYAIEACVDPGIGLGATPTCTGNPTRTVVDASTTFVPGSAATNYYGVLSSSAFTIPAAGVIFFDPKTLAARPAHEQANGVGYLVVLSLVTPTGETVSAFKRVVVSTKAAKNQNPAFGAPAVLFEGADAATYSLTTATVSAVAQATAASAETYVVQKSDGTAESKGEKLTVTWLVTSGEVRYTRTDPGATNAYTPGVVTPAPRSFLLVLRDDRGGSAVVAFDRP